MKFAGNSQNENFRVFSELNFPEIFKIKEVAVIFDTNKTVIILNTDKMTVNWKCIER